jgi:hypothetical protein
MKNTSALVAAGKEEVASEEDVARSTPAVQVTASLPWKETSTVPSLTDTAMLESPLGSQKSAVTDAKRRQRAKRA